MKNIYLAIAVCLSIYSCDNVDINANSNTGNDEAKNPPSRDVSITPENSYSDLFLDTGVVEDYIRSKNLDNNSAQGMRNFYNVRNYQFAWFASDGFTEQGRGFWNLYDWFSDREKNSDQQIKGFANRVDSLFEEDSISVSASDSIFVNTELTLTQQFLQFARNHPQQGLRNASTNTEFLPVKKVDAITLADSILRSDTNANTNRPYNLLRQKLEQYTSVAKQGGWQPITSISKQIKKGTSSPAVSTIKRRLQLTGDMQGTDTSRVFNDSLEVAIKSFQERNGFRPTGVITDSLVKALNVPVEQRIQQILVNMNRMYWMPAELPNNIIDVNIPDFKLHVYEGTTEVIEMPVIVGKEGTNTMMFTGNLNQVVFSPYWNIPESIVKNEIMPKMKKDPNYLKKNNMEIVKQNDSIPTIRQLPGPENSLGRVKFLFPNSFDIYLHDTPEKNLFQKQNRAFSHGCIRVAQPEKLANYVLRNNQQWDSAKIKQAMNSDTENYVKVDNPIPVMITYFTAWVDEKGQLNFRNDVYSHDANTANKMFANSAFTNVSRPVSDTTRNRSGSDTAKRRNNVI